MRWSPLLSAHLARHCAPQLANHWDQKSSPLLRQPPLAPHAMPLLNQNPLLLRRHRRGPSGRACNTLALAHTVDLAHPKPSHTTLHRRRCGRPQFRSPRLAGSRRLPRPSKRHLWPPRANPTALARLRVDERRGLKPHPELPALEWTRLDRLRQHALRSRLPTADRCDLFLRARPRPRGLLLTPPGCAQPCGRCHLPLHMIPSNPLPGPHNRPTETPQRYPSGHHRNRSPSGRCEGRSALDPTTRSIRTVTHRRRHAPHMPCPPGARLAKRR